MNTVTFGNKNSFADFGLILKRKEIGEAEPRTNYIDVPARDGHLDATEAFGEVKFKERKLIFTFSYIGSDANWTKALSAINNYINGRRHNIYFEQGYYWSGRGFVDRAQTVKGIREFTIEFDCDPYKYKMDETIINVVADGDEVTHTILNDRKTVTPRVEVLSGAVTLSWTDARTETTFTIALESGFNNKILDFKFYEGVNVFKVSGTGEIKLTYREGSL